MEGPRRLPIWPALLAIVAWFPIAPMWKSDDFIAVNYAMDLSRVLHDFVGNQYGLPGMVWFYRPCITLSFWLDGILAGRDPVVWCWISHVSNVLAHAISVLLFQRVAGRFFSVDIATWAAALWAVAPGHAGSIAWAVGRVDSHTCVWILLSAHAYLRWQDGRARTRSLALLAQVLALMSKELALVIPGLVLVLGFCAAPAGARLRMALRGVWPFLGMQVAYLGYRYLLFGRVLGGYEGSLPPLPELAKGLATFTWYSLNPLAWLPVGNGWSRVLGIAGLLPAVLGLGAAARMRAWKPLTACTLLYLGCALPVLHFWPHTANLQNLRYFYLPLAALLPLVACGRGVAGLLLLLASIPPLFCVRMVNSSSPLRFEATPALEIGPALEALPAGPVFLSLPRARDWEERFVHPFHLGVDRLAQRPFGPGRHRTLAWRPLSEREHASAGKPSSWPPGTQLLEFDTSTTWWPASRPSSVPACEVALDGPAHWTSQLYWDLFAQRTSAAFVIRGVRAPEYRITVFTAGGWISAICRDEAKADALDGRVGYATWLQTATATGNADAFVVKDLAQPSVLDLDLRFPVWIEAGSLDPAHPDSFAPTRVASSLLWITLDRDYSEWVAGRVHDRK